MAQLEHIEAIEKRLWSAADTLRANSNYASNEYFLPVMGLVFLRHAFSRFLGVKDAIEAGLPTRGGKTRPLTKEDFSQKSANVIEPAGGTVLDPACGSGGMFVQSARVVERRHENPTEKLTFYGLEKNATTIRLAKMNLAVHGLEGDIQKSITYYEDPHELLRKDDFVMANPPFNVDEIDADKVKSDPRLPFGLPGVNKNGKVSNGNYVWISYFYSYLNEQGRAGFVMSSQASSAGRDEAKVRRKLVETGDVDVMVAIRSNFFYTRTVPCELWFLNRAKPEAYRDKVLMIDARNVYRKVTRKIFDFSPEQEQNLLAIVWLYRGETGRYLDLVAGYCQRMLAEGAACFTMKDDDGETVEPLPDFIGALATLRSSIEPFLKTLAKDAPHIEPLKELDDAVPLFKADVEAFRKTVSEQQAAWGTQKTSNGELKKAVDRLATLAETSRDLVKQTDLLYKLACRLIDTLTEATLPSPSGRGAGGEGAPKLSELRKRLRELDTGRAAAVEQVKLVRYFWKQAHWLTERFPEAELRDVEGLVKLVDRAEIAANDWSLTPGRYVGVAPEEEDEDFDFEEALRDIHVELEDLNAEAVHLAATIKRNFEELGV
ncbi:MAG: DNA methyltransferase [Sedimenticola sp.]|nr:MAG: DNA methyltransferase [Sedimenticola sp.]